MQVLVNPTKITLIPDSFNGNALNGLDESGQERVSILFLIGQGKIHLYFYFNETVEEVECLSIDKLAPVIENMLNRYNLTLYDKTTTSNPTSTTA